MADLLLKCISKKFNDNMVIDSLDLEIKSGQFITLLGPSGCGKTTLLRMIAGLEHIDKGEIYIGGKKYNEVPVQKRPIAMVFQSYALFPHMSVRDNIIFGLKIKKLSRNKILEKVEWVIPMLGLTGLEGRLPKEISGGQRQRVALARALVLDPEVLLLDEPLSNLDAALRDLAMEELKRIHRKVGKTIIYVTHNQSEAMIMSERIALINSGKIEQYDTPTAVYDNPDTIFASEFIGSPKINMFKSEIALSNGNVGVKTGAGYFLLDRERGTRAVNNIGKSVIAGIRPQNILSSVQISGRRFSDTTVTVVVELIETMGDRSLVVGRTEQNEILRFIISRDEEIAVDSKMTVYIDGRRIHVFDPETKLNLFDNRTFSSEGH